MYYTDFAEIPRNQYNLVLADPAWQYGDKMAGHSFSLDHEYPVMSLAAIKALPVKEITTKDSALALWVTNPMLPVGLEVMKAWGFKFKTVLFCWVKKMSSGKDAVNLGRWTMGGTELCLLGTRGSPQRLQRNIRQVVYATRGRHSEKPLEVRMRLERLFGDVPRIELFARGQSEGWDQFGNEPEKML